jgi:hypothetical protein
LFTAVRFAVRCRRRLLTRIIAPATAPPITSFLRLLGGGESSGSARMPSALLLSAFLESTMSLLTPL